jgi:hypothetical protein
MKFASGVALFLLCTVLAAQQDDDMKQKTEKMKAEMTKIRGLKFKNEVTVGVYSKAELQKFITGEFERELPRAKAKKFEKVYAHFGLIPKDMDLYDSLIVLFSESIAGFYHPKTKELRLVNPDEEGDEGKAMGIDMQAITLVHELCHAAQDQNFDLVTVPMEEEYNDDMIAGVKCLIEGEASAVGWKYGFADTFDQVIKMVNNSYKTGQLPGKANKLPNYLKLTLTFSYGYGCDFVLACLKGFGGDWEKISKMYDDLPSSTEQVLHPEKYWKERDNPTIITLPQPGKEFQLLTHNVHGEFPIQILLQEMKINKRERESAAAGWDGDRYYVYERNGKVSSVWFTTWDSEQDAKEFMECYRKAIATKYPKGDEKLDGDKSVYSVKLNTGEEVSVLIERRGSDVLVIDGEKDLQRHAADCWRGALKEELKKVERFKVGLWGCKDHPQVEKDVNSYCPECGNRLTVEKPKKDEKKPKKDYR